PLVLCCLEGQSGDEAARQLGCSLSTLKRRLSRGRELLRTRLARRGLTLSAALAAALVAPDHAPAGLPAALAEATPRAALAGVAGGAAVAVPPGVRALADGVLRALFLARLRMVAVCLLALSLATGTALFAYRAGVARPGTALQAAAPEAAQS